MKIAICTIGSRGDVQPFLVLGQFLSQSGHQVTVSSAKMYESLASDYEVKYQSFEGDFAAIVDDEAIKKEVGNNPLTIRQSLKEKVYPIIENSLESFYELAMWADVVLYHPKTMIDGIGESFHHKLVKAYVVPVFTPTEEFTNPVLCFLPFPKFLNRLSYWFANFAMRSFNTPVRNFRNRHGLTQTKSILDTPAIYGISPSFLERPKDYPQDVHFTGFWTKKSSKQNLSNDLVSFLSDNKKVLLFTLGSMPYKSSTDINKFVKGLTDNLDLKILIVRGWGLKNTQINQNEKVMAVDSAPFDLLFPRADFVVHHGGAGTTAIALKAGIPQMILPVLHPFGDQYFWGRQLEKKGVGVATIPLKKLTVQDLIKNVKKLISEELATNAKHLKRSIDKENGLLKVKAILEKHYSQQRDV